MFARFYLAAQLNTKRLTKTGQSPLCPSDVYCKGLRGAHVQRDYGRRDDRKQARLKYLVDEWGVPKFRSVVEQYLGKKFEPFRSFPRLSQRS